jgi:uroporphyrinogen decarboxylase
MSSRQRLLAALNKGIPDRLPVTTHHLMSSFLETYMNGMSNDEFFDEFGMDGIRWVNAHKPDLTAGDYFDPNHRPGYLEARRVVSDNWRIEEMPLEHPAYKTMRYNIITPAKTLTTVLQSDSHTTWVAERLIKEKSDVDVIARYAPVPLCDVDAVNREADDYGERGIIRGAMLCFDIYGQPGCWQDASCLYGIEDLIMETFDDPEWVYAFLHILRERKSKYIASLEGARFDLIELGGGDASTTVISPAIFEQFVAPYDTELIAQAHAAGQSIVYHTCGGMMPILEQIAEMKPDAMETFTPESMGGDTVLSEAKQRIGDKVCMIGGFDQFHFFLNCAPEETRRAVRKCFEEAGPGGGYILAPSDHFFDADPELLKVFAEEARECGYSRFTM